jgi:formate dehydrogenase
VTLQRIEKAKKLMPAVTAGIGSDHVNLEAAIKHNITVAGVTASPGMW